jgi:hypothetical protein
MILVQDRLLANRMAMCEKSEPGAKSANLTPNGVCNSLKCHVCLFLILRPVWQKTAHEIDSN